MTSLDMERLRPGTLGLWDRIVGPGMTLGETGLVLAASILGGVAAAARMLDATGSMPMAAVVGLAGFDILGGAVCNATATTRAWYHRPGQGWREHVLFVLPHLAYVVLVAAFARGPGFDAPYAVVFSLGLMAGSMMVITAPARLKAPVAFASFLTLLVGLTIAFGPTRGLEWFAPGLLLKLLLGHLVGPGPRSTTS